MRSSAASQPQQEAQPPDNDGQPQTRVKTVGPLRARRKHRKHGTQDNENRSDRDESELRYPLHLNSIKDPRSGPKRREGRVQMRRESIAIDQPALHAEPSRGHPPEERLLATEARTAQRIGDLRIDASLDRSENLARFQRTQRLRLTYSPTPITREMMNPPTGAPTDRKTTAECRDK